MPNARATTWTLAAQLDHEIGHRLVVGGYIMYHGNELLRTSIIRGIRAFLVRLWLSFPSLNSPAGALEYEP